jgi:hypothetical protein
MSQRVVRVTALFLFLAASISVLAGAPPVAAQSQTLGKDDTCIACHEDLYVLHDTGKWFCLCEVQASCTDCHGGVVGETDVEAAHLGMIANPVASDPDRCQSCHPGEYKERLSEFAARGGLSATPCPTEPVPIPMAAPPGPPFPDSGLAGWQSVILGILGVAFAGLAWFAYHCWKADCLRKPIQP